MSWVSTLSSVLMAIGPPLAYADQFISILRKKDSTGFSIDICGVLIIANITRIFYWFGVRFELALLVQSILMIIAQFALLFICIKYGENRGGGGEERESLTGGSKNNSISSRPYQFWAWPSFGTYIEFAAALIVLHTVLFFALGSFEWYKIGLGFAALGLEATLPIPQLISNYTRGSTSGFRLTVLAGWVGGDAWKVVYFFLQPNNSIAFKACALFQFSIDILLVGQTWYYSRKESRNYAQDLEEE